MKNRRILISIGKYIILVITIIWFILIELFPAIKMPEIRDIWNETVSCVGTLHLIHNIPEVDDINFLGRRFPTKSTEPHGAMEYYLLLPFFFFGGATLVALRIGLIFWGIIILILSYYLGYKLFNSVVGILSVILLAVNPFFLNSIRIGMDIGSTLLLFCPISLLLFFKWHKKRKILYFNLGMFFLGLGFNVRGWFIWFIISLFVTGILLYAPYDKIRLRTVITGLISMALGLFPIFYHYTRSGLYKVFFLKYAIITREGGNNLEIIRNLLIRLGHFNSLLVGPERLGNSLKIFPIFFFWICLVWLLYLVFIRKKTILSRQRIIFILSLFFITFLMSVFTFTVLRDGHMNILFPFIQIIIGIAIFEMLKSNRYKLSKTIIFLLFFMLVAINVGRCVEDYHNLKIEKDRKASCNISVVTGWLLENKIYSPICFNDAICIGIIFYSNLKITPYEFSNKYLVHPLSKCHSDIFFARVKNIMMNASPNDFFIFDLQNDSGKYEVFKLISKKLNREIITNKKFLWSDGSTRFIIHSLK